MCVVVLSDRSAVSSVKIVAGMKLTVVWFVLSDSSLHMVDM